MIALDTSTLIDCLTGPKRLEPALRRILDRGDRIVVPSVVLYEWLRGPRSPQEMAWQEALFPSESAAIFGPREAALSAELYRSLRRARGREMDIAIAATAILKDAELWTLNAADFADIPKLRLAKFS